MPIKPPPLREENVKSPIWVRWFQALTDFINDNDYSNKADKVTPSSAGNIAGLNASGNLSDTGKSLPSGNVVGTSDTQTLTNKTLTSPSSSDHTVSDLTATRLVATNGSKVLVGVAALSSWVAGTTNQITVTDDGDGTITLSTPQDIHSTATPTFDAITINGNIVVTGTVDGVDVADLNNNALLGDGTAGRVARHIQLTIDDGTNANTLKCTVSSLWNGDTIVATDNVAKGATTGNFTLDANGEYLTVEASGLSGNTVMATGHIASNPSGTALTVDIKDNSNDIYMATRNNTTGALQDLTALVDSGAPIEIYILHLTDA